MEELDYWKRMFEHPKVFIVSKEDYDAFVSSLDEPPKMIPGLSKLVKRSMTFEKPTKLDDFLEGFDIFRSALYWLWCSKFYNEFWDEINFGWQKMQDDYIMSQPGFDPWNLRGRNGKI